MTTLDMRTKNFNFKVKFLTEQKNKRTFLSSIKSIYEIYFSLLKFPKKSQTF